MWRYNYTNELYHYGVKGMKWGVRRTPEQLGRKKSKVEKTDKPGIVKITFRGHKSNPKQLSPNAIADRISGYGVISERSFYDSNGWKYKDIHTRDHGNPKRHFGGPHVTEFKWKENGELNYKFSRELTDEERKENDDIL